MEAEKACNADFNSRLAIAKDQARLDKIAGIMEGKSHHVPLVRNVSALAHGHC